MNTQNWKPVNFSAINALCMARLPSLLAHWLPNGRKQGREWVAPNPTRIDRHRGSFSINMETGKWADFATGDRGSDPISLYAFLNGLGQAQAARALRGSLGAML